MVTYKYYGHNADIKTSSMQPTTNILQLALLKKPYNHPNLHLNVGLRAWLVNR